jgi:hypothetical protein
VPEKLEGRVMVLERIINDEIPLIRAYMQKGVELRVENTKHLTQIQAACDASQEYQERCDTEREKLGTRVGSLETYRSNQAAAVTMRSSIVAGLVSAATLILGVVGIKYGKL